MADVGQLSAALEEQAARIEELEYQLDQERRKFAFAVKQRDALREHIAALKDTNAQVLTDIEQQLRERTSERDEARTLAEEYRDMLQAAGMVMESERLPWEAQNERG